MNDKDKSKSTQGVCSNELANMRERWRIAFAADGHDDVMALFGEIDRLRGVLLSIAYNDEPASGPMAREAIGLTEDEMRDAWGRRSSDG